MTFEIWWKEHSGYHTPGEDMGGSRKYNLAVAAWDAAVESQREEIARPEHWKAQAVAVLTVWEEVYKALGEPGKLGESKAISSLWEVRRLKAENAQLRTANSLYQASEGRYCKAVRTRLESLRTLMDESIRHGRSEEYTSYWRGKLDTVIQDLCGGEEG